MSMVHQLEGIIEGRSIKWVAQSGKPKKAQCSLITLEEPWTIIYSTPHIQNQL